MAAWFAGKYPKNNPVEQETTNATMTLRPEIGTRKFPGSSGWMLDRNRQADQNAEHRATAADQKSLDQKLVAEFLCAPAPMALRMPISRVRSRTVTNMMFMMPMPLIRSAIAAITSRTMVSASEIVRAAPRMATKRLHVVFGGQRMAALQQLRHFALAPRPRLQDSAACAYNTRKTSSPV